MPKYQGRYQAFPVGMWQEEFRLAKDCGLDLIEFILDFNDAEDNPLFKSGGSREIECISRSTGVSVKTICADYFMEAPLHSENEEVAGKSFKVLERLLETSELLKITDIVIPCVDQSSLKDKKMAERFVKQISKIIPMIENKDINLSLETDLAPRPFLELLNHLNSKNITVNYDIGNSAALGFDPIEELKHYGDRITDIHIKDRLIGGGPVFLGTGSANFPKFFSALSKITFQGPFIMQAYRDDEGFDIFKKQLVYIKEVMGHHLD